MEKEKERKDENVGEKIEETSIEEEMKTAYIDYAMSVIVSRALPSVEDGLKPVQRRILYTMHQMGLQHNKPTKKTARIVGDCMGRYHPHGDIAIYDALVRMAQPFSLRYPLIEGQGNFGSIDGDPPAAMRYTEARLNEIAEEMLQDLDKNTVKMLPNFDNSLFEPEVLPAKIPNLLINGSQGIAVGMMTNIPPHNLTEVCDAIIAYIKNPKIETNELMRYIPGPDFPTAGIVYSEGIEEIYKTGKGSLIIRGRASIEQEKGRERIVISELPYQVNKAEFIESIAKLVQAKKLEDISDIRDESAKGKIRVVITLKKGANSKLILNKLYTLTNLQTKFNVIMLALVGGQPKVLSLKNLIECYVRHRQQVIRRRTQFDLDAAKEQLHLLEGFLVALENLDAIVTFIRKSKNTTEALQGLVEKFKLTHKQAQAILDMKLSRLTLLEQEKIKKEHEETKKKIKELEEILASEQKILEIIKQELQEIKRKYADERRTKILKHLEKVSELDLVKKEEVAVLVTARGYIKRMPIKLYHEQHRGGKGVSAAELSEEDFVQQVFLCSTHDLILFLTERGKMYLLKAYQIPEATRYSKGKAIVNLLQISEKIKAALPVEQKRGSMLIVTKKGIAKRINLELFKKIKTSGSMVIKLPHDDGIAEAKITQDNEEIIIATKKGIAARFKASEIREMGKTAYGVRAIKLEKDDEVVGVENFSPEKEKELSVLSVTEKGFGKRTLIADYRRTARGAKGIINIKCSSKTGFVVGIQIVSDKDSIIVTTSKGMIIRVPCKDIRVMSRATRGVKIIKLKPEDHVSDVVAIKS
ncbi:MAG: DNA gyrase subunit A [Candidatus Pacearchaeota archaeon]